MKRLIVWKVMDWKPSKFSDYDYKRVAFKSYDKHEKGTFYLDITKNTQSSNWSSWEKVAKEGNILDVGMKPDGKVNQFSPFNIYQIKPVNQED